MQQHQISSFGKGLVKEKLWDNLEEKKQQLCKTQITQLCWWVLSAFYINGLALENPSALLKTCSAGYVVVFKER